MYACSLAAGAESLAIGGRRGCRALNSLRDVDPVRAAAVRPYVLRTVDWSLAVADYLPRTRRCLVSVPREFPSVANRHSARARAGARYACSLCSGVLHVMGLNRHRTIPAQCTTVVVSTPRFLLKAPPSSKLRLAHYGGWYRLGSATTQQPATHLRCDRTASPQRTRRLPVPVQAPLGANESPGRPTEGALTTHFHALAHHMALQL